MRKITFALLIATMTVLIMGSCAARETPAPADASPGAPKEARPAVAPQTGWEQQWSKTLAEARKEGKVVIYSTQGAAVRAATTSAFQPKFNIDVEFLSRRGEELTNRLLTEKRAGITVADVILGGATTQLTGMKPKGLLASMENELILPEALDTRVWRGGQLPFMDKERMVIGFMGTYLPVLLRNIQLIKEGEIQSYKDLLKPQYKGKIVLFDPTLSGASATGVTLLSTKIWSLEEATEYLTQLAKQDLVVSRDKRISVEWVARGKNDILIGGTLEQVAEFLGAGAPIAWVKVKEGGVITTGGGGLGLVKDRPHPNSARVFINWFLTQEGQAAAVEGFGTPSKRLDAPTKGIDPALFPDPGETLVAEDEQSILMNRKLIEMSKEIFGTLMK